MLAALKLWPLLSSFSWWAVTLWSDVRFHFYLLFSLLQCSCLFLFYFLFWCAFTGKCTCLAHLSYKDCLCHMLAHLSSSKTMTKAAANSDSVRFSRRPKLILRYRPCFSIFFQGLHHLKFEITNHILRLSQTDFTKWQFSLDPSKTTTVQLFDYVWPECNMI